ncbi:MAG: peptidase S58 family protein [Dehalococcoidia bacterium]|nr:peptidase S58 family protein [Dehalococcoidia bacterium]
MCTMSNAARAITHVQGIEVGHYTDLEHATGCTVVLCRGGAVGGVDIRGSAPGTRETDLLRPGNLVEHIHAIVLSGGSAYGLDAASGVMRYLEERGIGFRMGDIVVPIVPAAILYDLGLVTSKVRPGPQEGYRACEAASAGLVAEGSVGAGTGATVGKALGMSRAVKGGLGTASADLGDGLIVGAIAAVNAAGSVVDPETGRIIAGPRQEDNRGYHNTVELMAQPGFRRPQAAAEARVNTTLGVIATNAPLTKEQANKLAERGQDGLALAIRPCHTMGDGDAVFSLATGTWEGTVDRALLTRLGAVAAQVMSLAILRAVTQATGLGGVPSVQELGYA